MRPHFRGQHTASGEDTPDPDCKAETGIRPVDEKIAQNQRAQDLRLIPGWAVDGGIELGGILPYRIKIQGHEFFTFG